MRRRYLLGPVPPAFAEHYLPRQVRARECVTFSTSEADGLHVRPDDTWKSFVSRLPAGWQPDFVALWLPAGTVPPALWSTSLPLVGLVTDAERRWHAYRRRLAHCDLVLADTVTVEKLAQAGIPHALPANLSGCPRAWLEERPAADGRDIDLLVAGSLDPTFQHERLPWLMPAARLGERWRVHFQMPDAGPEGRRLSSRARIVLTWGQHGECGPPVFAAAAAGALVSHEADNREVPAYFRDRQECVACTPDSLEALATHYLEREDERRSLAEAARQRAQQYGFEDLWEAALEQLESQWTAMTERARNRPRPSPAEALLGRCDEVLSGTQPAPAALLRDIHEATRAPAEAAALGNALGLLRARTDPGQSLAAQAEAAAADFRHALAAQPAVVVGLNLAEALALADQRLPAIDQARRTLALLEQLPALGATDREAGHFPPRPDLFRGEWERAAWDHAGQPAAEEQAKRRLLQWRLHALLAELTDDLTHHYEAYLARPDLPAPRAALGGALVRAGRPVEALPHLRAAVAANPLEREAARALFHTLGAAGRVAEQHGVAYAQRLLSQAVPGMVPSESWFATARPLHEELASLIVLCCNEVAYTRMCLESVLRHTERPYELLLVDNGSTDATPAYLEEVGTRPGPVRVEVIRNDTNRGFPVGANQGRARAQGNYLVFLNNDTVVTEGWLEGLIARTESASLGIGLVGPVSNYAAAPQHVPTDYTDAEGLGKFADGRRRGFAGRSLAAARLSSFCLLVRRAVLERIGGFDERFGIGLYDDDDLCLRAREAGFGMAVALDVFVHHFGSQTFKGLGLDVRQQLLRSRELFRAKWGQERAAGAAAREPAAPPAGPGAAALAGPPAAPAGRKRVSLTMIVRNEEANLGACLSSVADVVDDMVVVDTGSTDRTKEVATRHGARVFDFPWVDSFADARNESLRHATGDWVLWLDADDRLDEENRAKLRQLFEQLGDENTAYVMKVRSPVNPTGSSVRILDQVRLFRNHPYIRWRYRVHEQILPAIGQWGGRTRWVDVVIQHTGYQDPAFRRRKLERNLHLLELEVHEQPEDPFTLFNLGRSYLDLERTADALPILRKSLERSGPNLSIVRKLYALIAQAHQALGQRAEALAVCGEGLARYPDDAELLFQQAMLQREQKDLPGAEATLQRLLHSRPGEYFDMVDAGVRGYKARHHLAAVCQEQGKAAEAEQQWRAAVEERPDFAPGWLGLAELYLSQSRWSDLEPVIQRLEAEPAGQLDAGLFRARAYLARHEYQAARRVLEDVIPRAPQAVRPRVLLTHSLLGEGQDWDAAEQALREVLALAPDHPEARHNLNILLRRQGRAAEMPS
jgi:GT2 family glycosyltransferase/tetratricopeptide (TPR) repeat protein